MIKAMSKMIPSRISGKSYQLLSIEHSCWVLNFPKVFRDRFIFLISNKQTRIFAWELHKLLEVYWHEFTLNSHYPLKFQSAFENHSVSCRFSENFTRFIRNWRVQYLLKFFYNSKFWIPRFWRVKRRNAFEVFFLQFKYHICFHFLLILFAKWNFYIGIKKYFH